MTGGQPDSQYDLQADLYPVPQAIIDRPEFQRQSGQAVRPADETGQLPAAAG